MSGRLTSVSEPRRQQPKMVRRSEAMARESLGWRGRGQANRTGNPKLYFSVREEEKEAGLREYQGDGGVQETRRLRGSSWQRVRCRCDIYNLWRVQNEPSRGFQHAIDGKKEKGRYIDKSRATA